MRTSLSLLTTSLLVGTLLPLSVLAEEEYTPPAAVDAATDHIRGNVNAPASVIVYTDFECPFCQRHHPVMQKLLSEYDNKVRLVYRNYPLEFHVAALPAALAAECVAILKDNDSYWKFVDKLFATEDIESFPLRSTAIGMGVDGAAFDKCIKQQSTSDRVEKDHQDGIKAGVMGTPATFIVTTKGSQMLSGAQPYEEFAKVLNALNLQAAEKMTVSAKQTRHGMTRLKSLIRKAGTPALRPGARRWK